MTFNQYEHKVHSQFGEDGIIEHILNVIGEKSKKCVEIGFDSEGNTLNLVMNKSWHGILVDSNIETCSKMKYLEHFYNVKIIHTHVTVENINNLFPPEDIDVLSIDVDGIDYYLWQSLQTLNPRVVIIEYNASFGPEKSITVKYRPNFNRFALHPCYHGASLTALAKLGKQKGYKLVGCDSDGVNAFFVKNDEPLSEVLVADAFRNHSKRGPWNIVFRSLEPFEFVEV